MDVFLKEVKDQNIGKIEEDVFLSKYTTYKVGGLAKCVIYPKDISKLVQLIKLINKYNVKYKVIGNGSNLLFSDKRFDGVIIKLNNLDKLEIVGNKMIVGAGYSLMKLSLVAMKNSLTGLEFAAGIPGTVGGAIFMNAGAYKSDMGYVVKGVKVLTDELEIINLTNKEMDFHYRSSFLQTHPNYICLEAIISLSKGEKSAIEKVMKDRKKRRLESQPLEYPSAGSVFRNPEEKPAWRYIDEAGLRGYEIGGAQVSPKHSNFIVNNGYASAKDILDLIRLVEETVYEKFGVKLHKEVILVNWD